MNPIVIQCRASYLDAILNDQADKIKDIDISAREADRVINKLLTEFEVKEDEIKGLGIELSTYGKNVEFNGIKNKPLYNNLIMALTALYGEGEREKSYGDNIRYLFRSVKDDASYSERVNRVFIVAKVSTEITGCKITPIEVEVAERVIPAHKETEYKIECEKVE
jgi:hypothetical protein